MEDEPTQIVSDNVRFQIEHQEKLVVFTVGCEQFEIKTIITPDIAAALEQGFARARDVMLRTDAIVQLGTIAMHAGLHGF